MTGIFGSKRRKGLTLAVAALSFAGALTILGTFGAHGAVPKTGPLSVHAGLENPPRSFVRGNALFSAKGSRSQLEAAVSGAMMGPLSPVAVRSNDGTLVAYNTWQETRPVDEDQSFSKQGIVEGEVLGTPSLRVHDEAGKDVLLARGAYSAAWRPDGAIAFVKGVDPNFRAGRTYIGQIVVRRDVHSHETAWTTDPAHYVVYAWAGDRLLFYRVGLGERLELFVAEGPGRIRALADGSAVAVSPDATRVAVLSQDATNVRVLDIATGSELSWLDVTTASPPLVWLAYSGSWVGDHIVTPAKAGLAVLHVAPHLLELEQVLSLDHAQFPVGVQEPRFVDASANQIAASADVPPAKGGTGVSFLLQCNRVTRICERGEPAPAKDWLRLVDDAGAGDEGGH
jgi:hypothetical protein